MKYIKFLIITISLLLINTAIYSQTSANQSKIKLAETFENSGEYENASRLYLELLDDYPNNDNFLYGYSRSMIALNMYSKLLPTIEKYVNIKPSNKLYNLYAEVLWKLGKIDSANLAWENAINKYPQNLESYKNTSISQTNNMQFNSAIATLTKARIQFKNKDLFIDELSKLYNAIGDYKNAVSEIFAFFETERNYPQTQGRLQALTLNNEAKSHILDKLKSNKDNPNRGYKVLYAWYLSLIGDYEASMQQYTEIDKESNSNGAELYSFALARQKDEQYDIALKAFGKVIDFGKKSPYLLNAMFGYNRVIENKMLLNKNLDNKEFEYLIKKYREIIELYPNNNFAFDAQYRIALIYLNNLKEIDKSINELNSLLTKIKTHSMVYSINNTIGDIYLYKDDLNKALEYYSKSSNIKLGGFENEKYYAMYKIAEILYYKGEMDSAQSIYSNLATIIDANIANDAFEKSVLIGDNKNLIKALNDYAQSEKLALQDKDSLAILKLDEVIKFSSGDLLELAIIGKSNIYIENNDYNNSIMLLTDFINKFPNSIYLEKVYFNLGNVFQLDNQLNQAETTFSKLLEKFPRSIYIEKTRNKIREIRMQVSS